MMHVSKYVVNISVFVMCFVICLILFSLKDEKVKLKPLFRDFNPNQSVKLFDLDLKYLINNDCDGNITVVMIITSYYSNIEVRSAIRRSFSSENLKKMSIRRVFLLAIGPKDDKYVSYNAILNENVRFSDLIQGNFVEAYRNLTYKHLMGLHWASTYCNQAKFIIKMDDDIVVNMHKIYYILNTFPLNENKLLAGYVLRGMVPIREPANKWFVTKEEYEKSVYPLFISGWFYVTTPKVAERMIQESKSTPYFWIDDVYVTGILANKLKIKHFQLNQLFAVHSEYIQCCIRDTQEFNYDCEFLIGPNGGDSNLFFTFNDVMSKCNQNKCVARPIGKKLNNTCVAEKKIIVGRGKPVIEDFRLF